MSTVATRHPAVLARDALSTVVTELVRANIAPRSITIQPISYNGKPSVLLQVQTHLEYRSAVSLFGLGDEWRMDVEDREIVSSRGWFMDVRVECIGPAPDEIPADCDAASHN